MDRSGHRYAGLAWFDGHDFHLDAQQAEPLYTDIHYELIDRAFDHSSLYAQKFSQRVAPTMLRLTGRSVTAGMPVEIGRGCIKFARNDACSFCSIQYGGMWRNSVLDGESAWDVLHGAHQARYDYLYLTADELPLTFGRLLRDMSARPPHWWSALPEDERPVMVGYARADGLSDERAAANLRSLGIRQLMVGLDAGTAVSLRAMKKPLSSIKDGNSRFSAERMYEHNAQALRSAKNVGLVLKVGFVVGHLGMNPTLLRENVELMKGLLVEGAEAIASLDVEVLSPEPGSLDFTMLLDPEAARARGAELGLPLPDRGLHGARARKWRGKDIIDREAAMADYVESVMPDLSLADLSAARSEVRAFGKSLGITIGG